MKDDVAHRAANHRGMRVTASPERLDDVPFTPAAQTVGRIAAQVRRVPTVDDLIAS